MKLIQWLTGGRWQARLAELAEQAATRCHDTVWDRVHPRLAEFSLPEVRGYVRARSVALVEREVDYLLVVEGAPAQHAQTLRDLTIDAVVRQIVWRLLKAKPHRTPALAPAAAARKAA